MNKHHRFSSIWFCLVIILLTITLPLLGQEKKLSYQQAYMRGEPRLQGSMPRVVEWLDDDHYLEQDISGITEMMRYSGRGSNAPLYKIHAGSGQRELFLDYSAYKDALPEGFRLARNAGHTDDYTSFLFNQKNDLHYFSTKTKQFKTLTETAEEENNPLFSPDGSKIAYTRDHNLFIVDVASGQEHQLTTDGSDTIYNGWASWVYYEEILGRRSRYRAFWWSPDASMIAFLWFDDSVTPTFPLYRADGTHGELEIERYPKPGDSNPKVKLGIAHLKSKEIVWVDTEVDADQYIAWPFWTPDSKQLFFQWMNRGQDHIILYSADPATGEKKLIHEERQSAWVEFFEDLYFFENGNGFLLRSDVDGWSHLYHYGMDGKLKNRLTQGKWAVRNIALVDEKNNAVYFHGFLNESTNNHLFRVSLSGKRIKQFTTISGSHRCQVSPGGKYFIDTYSSIEKPPRMDLVRTGRGTVRTLGDAKLDVMDEYALGKTEIFRIPSGDGYELPVIWTLPPDMDTTKHHPVIFAIYGGPASGRVMNRWVSMSTHYLAQNGIITIAVDHRGSGHFGKEGVALMHRSLGKWEMQDLITAVKWLREQPFICKNRMGITGGSYGGYTTCMALTYGAGYFTHGIAGSSVTDWRLYDTVYTERYMDTPKENPKGYEFGSVMTHAENLKGVLRITHGTMDDNVHMQNSIQLIDKLTDLNKSFELMLYPGERHGIRPPKRAHATRESVAFWFRQFFKKDLVIEETEE